MSVRVMFYGLLAVLTVTLAVICACESVQGDSWQFHVDARIPLTWDRFVAHAEHGYFAGNPRWGQLVLPLMFHAQAIAIVVTPLVIVAMLLALVTLIRGRWPRPSDRADSWLLVHVLAAVIVMTPQFGAIWFNRPTCANYIYPLLVQLAWLIPYRFISVAPCTTPRRHAIAIVPLGVLAGAGNEHTGIALGLAAALCTYVAARRDRTLPAWPILGLVALAMGYIALLAAPVQMIRYGGLAAERSPLDTIAARGIGNLVVVGLLLAWASPMLVVGASIAGRALLRTRTWLPRPSARVIAGCAAVAAVMVATSLASPRLPPRMLVAPATMLALALGVFMVELATFHEKERRLRIASAIISTLALGITLAIFIVTAREGRERVRRLETAPPGSAVCVPSYTFSAPTPFSWGDDLRSANVTERVARLFGLARLERDCDQAP